MRPRSKTTYEIAVSWLEKNIYTPGAEDRGLFDHPCVRLCADIFRRKSIDVSKDIYLARVQRDAQENHNRRASVRRLK